MPKYKKNYITADHFELLQKIGVDYEGFVEGVGYVYNIYLAFTPPHMDISVPLRYAPPGMDQFIIGWMQCIDSSEEIIKMSYGDKETVAVEEGSQSQGDGLGTIPVNAIGPPLIDFAGNVLEGKHNAALAENLDNLLPYSIDINTGKTTWVNPKYMKNKNLTIRGGNMLIFLYNEFGTFGDLRSGAISTDQFWTNTGINGLGSISPQYGGMFLYMEVLDYSKNAWNQYNSKPNALRQFYNNMNSSFDDWRRSMNGGF